MATFITLRNADRSIKGYRVRYNYRPRSIDGKPHDERDFAASREAAARAFHAEIEATPVVPRGGRRILDITAAYLASERYLELDQSTRNDVESTIRVHIDPGVGKLRHDRIVPREVKDWQRAMILTGFAHLSKLNKHGKQSSKPPKPVKIPTANKAFRYAKAIMRWARVEGLTTCRAFEEVKALTDKRPRAERRAEPRAYSDAEKQQLVSACETLMERTILEVGWDSGLRRGELFALCRDAILWDTSEIRVKRALNPDGTFKDPKTHEFRTVPVFDDGMAALRTWIEHAPDNDRGLLFCTPHGDPLHATWEASHAGGYRERRPTAKRGTRGGAPVRVLTDGIRKRSGIHLELGHCRDTYAAELFALGLEPEEICLAMGHESVETTRRHYASWLAARRAQVGDLVRSARAARRRAADA